MKKTYYFDGIQFICFEVGAFKNDTLAALADLITNDETTLQHMGHLIRFVYQCKVGVLIHI
jgi:hypothetical protein